MKTAFGERMARLGVSESDIEESFTTSSGPGGQNVNKVSTAVTLRYRGITVISQDSRSQAMNRKTARERLLDAIENARRTEQQQRRSEAEKKRRQNRKRPRGLKERILQGKKKRGEIKRMRTRFET